MYVFAVLSLRATAANNELQKAADENCPQRYIWYNLITVAKQHFAK
jgi:hypothetical protein